MFQISLTFACTYTNKNSLNNTLLCASCLPQIHILKPWFPLWLCRVYEEVIKLQWDQDEVKTLRVKWGLVSSGIGVLIKVLGNTLTKAAHSPGAIVTINICMSYLTTGGSSKEHGNKQATATRGKVRRKHHVSCLFPESFSLVSVLAEQFRCHQEDLNQSDRPDNPKTNPITMKPEIVSHVAEQSHSGALAYCSLPLGAPSQ